MSNPGLTTPGLPIFLFLVLLSAGCERGWLTSWLASHGVGEGNEVPSSPGSLRLHWADCPAGLARCVEGAVELSQAFRHPEPCKGGPESCACPWQTVGRCPGACVADEVSVPLSVERASKQLCAIGPGEPPVAQPPPLGTPPTVICGEEPYRCAQSEVVGCPSGQIIATCLRGCASEGEALDDPTVDATAAVYLLCSR